MANETTAPQNTPAAAESLAGKLKAFSAGLSADENAVLTLILERATTPREDEDTSGYWGWFDYFFRPTVSPIASTGGANIVTNAGANLGFISGNGSAFRG